MPKKPQGRKRKRLARDGDKQALAVFGVIGLAVLTH
jgi:hypothetical protein